MFTMDFHHHQETGRYHYEVEVNCPNDDLLRAYLKRDDMICWVKNIEEKYGIFLELNEDGHPGYHIVAHSFTENGSWNSMWIMLNHIFDELLVVIEEHFDIGEPLFTYIDDCD